MTKTKTLEKEANEHLIEEKKQRIITHIITLKQRIETAEKDKEKAEGELNSFLEKDIEKLHITKRSSMFGGEITDIED